jgi:hypothetical protein
VTLLRLHRWRESYSLLQLQGLGSPSACPMLWILDRMYMIFSILEGSQIWQLRSVRRIVPNRLVSLSPVEVTVSVDDRNDIVGELSGNRRRVRGLWVGLIAYFMIMINAFRYVHRIPYLAFLAGALVNVAIIAMFVLALRRAYRQIGR